MTKYYVYLLLCADGTYYTGITNDPERRLQEHESGTHMNAYTYTRRPVQLVWYDAFQTPTAAIEIDKQIKGWSHRKKQALIEGRFTDLRNLAVCQNAPITYVTYLTGRTYSSSEHKDTSTLGYASGP